MKERATEKVFVIYWNKRVWISQQIDDIRDIYIFDETHDETCQQGWIEWLAYIKRISLNDGEGPSVVEYPELSI